MFGLNEMILLHVSLCPNLNTVYHFAFKLLCVKNIDPETTLGVLGPRADHDRAGPEYRYRRRLRYRRHPSTTLRNLNLKKDFKQSMYQHFQFTGEYSLTNS